ncbi:MAG TPA: Stp1/IreP family PP2C-type Ser/Thr phosphatase [Ruminiclostridium sp.]|uniref:Protein phosphatase n=1 Tax=Acetivibrio saccincola TaxID=1677857 RepID=A0A2S8RBV8_9FIRM|nr:Stp1/IreP family PP2C-type Ser/Thr phosphatase [Acetivibrio saccincola]HAA43809.1 Stp1/IreP family PP2C-type Ser/Thr phosphatase [Ruminiclostridium sp.]NLW27897.1 Stp1/IreP family PP2C-type Ser/Thr phosphatase [Acetivibrio saccincola]PQQ67282.1 protein phosphatase [Acetivibrio saccincola]HOA97693.1 Stp1/IreP family PP2C-type Ser/Thr phosphatase [Acetivibrio saccincola]HQD28582.1 Stp1/IreP family PP2C-type Ser/Thr phosphatase [Acetivibrio saccincola]
MRFAAISDKGIVRDVNEDSYRIITGQDGVPDTFIIADGMGGHSSGDVASNMAVDFAKDYILNNPEIFSSEDSVLEGIRNLIEEANRAIYEKASQSKETLGMGTTFILTVVLKDKLYIGHVGDSRLYLIRDNTIKKLTTDHSYIEELILNGSITREEAKNHPKKNIITRALGCNETILVDTLTSPVNKDDIFVLCTDGLTNMLSEYKIMEIILKNDDLNYSCNELVRLANEKGGEDNITVIIMKKS